MATLTSLYWVVRRESLSDAILIRIFESKMILKRVILGESHDSYSTNQTLGDQTNSAWGGVKRL